MDLFTGITTALAGMTNGIAQANPTLLRIGVILYGVAASIGPLLLAVFTLGKLAVPLAIGRLGLLGTAVAALINPIGALAGLFVKLVFSMGGASFALKKFALLLGRSLGPIGLLVTAMTVLYFWMNQAAVANDHLQKSGAAAEQALAKQKEQTALLATATGKLRQELLAKIRADQASAIAAGKAAKADVLAAIAARERIRADTHSLPVRALSPSLALTEKKSRDQADADAQKSIETLNTLAETINGYTAALAGAPMDLGTIDTNFDTAGKDKKSSGPSAAELANRREELKLQQMLDVATARGDIDEERRVGRLIDLHRRVLDYEDAGLDTAAARIAAAQDMRALQEGEAETNARNLAISEDELDLQIAQITNDRAIIDLKERERDLRARIQEYREMGIPLAEAEMRAAEDIVSIEAARLVIRQKLNAEAERERAADLARLRGDSEATIRRLNKSVEEDRRTGEYQDRFGLTEAAARDRAKVEIDEEDKARLQGDFRDVIKGGFRAALDGDFKGFVKNWWKDRVAKGMEEALNSLSDMLMKLFGAALSQGGARAGGGGGIGGLLSGIGSLFGSGGGLNMSSSFASLDSMAAANVAAIPKFATGGSFKVGGRSGIDQNLIQFRASKGEMVDIRKPGNDNGGRVTIVPTPYFDAVVDNRAASVAAPLAQAGALGGAALAQQNMARRARNQIPRSR